MRISTVGYTVKQGVKNIGRNKMFSLASIATMSACIFLFGLFFAIVTNFQYIMKTAEEGVAIVVYFEDETTQDQINEIGDQLRSRDEVLRAEFISADEAWEKFQTEYFGEASDLAEGFKNDNPLQNSANYEVYMKHTEDDKDLAATQKELVEFAQGLDGVRKVNRSDMVAKTLSSMNVLIGYVSVAIILILLAVSVFLISNTVTMGITVRREEIAIMKYIGAKDVFVRAPFVIEGLVIGVIGALIPLILLYFLYNKAVVYILTKFQILNNLLEFLPVGQVYQTLLPVGLALGIGIGFVGSFFTIRKHLRV